MTIRTDLFSPNFGEDYDVIQKISKFKIVWIIEYLQLICMLFMINSSPTKFQIVYFIKKPLIHGYPKSEIATKGFFFRKEMGFLFFAESKPKYLQPSNHVCKIWILDTRLIVLNVLN